MIVAGFGGHDQGHAAGQGHGQGHDAGHGHGQGHDAGHGHGQVLVAGLGHGQGHDAGHGHVQAHAAGHGHGQVSGGYADHGHGQITGGYADHGHGQVLAGGYADHGHGQILAGGHGHGQALSGHGPVYQGQHGQAEHGHHGHAEQGHHGQAEHGYGGVVYAGHGHGEVHGVAPVLQQQQITVNKQTEVGVGPHGEVRRGDLIQKTVNTVEGATPIGVPYSPYGHGGVVYMGNGLISEHAAGVHTAGPVLPPPGYQQHQQHVAINKQTGVGPYGEIQSGVTVQKQSINTVGHGALPHHGGHPQIYQPQGNKQFLPGVYESNIRYLNDTVNTMI